MTDTHFLILLGTIWIAPHVNNLSAQVTGIICIGIAVCKGLGWV